MSKFEVKGRIVEASTKEEALAHYKVLSFTYAGWHIDADQGNNEKNEPFGYIEKNGSGFFFTWVGLASVPDGWHSFISSKDDIDAILDSIEFDYTSSEEGKEWGEDNIDDARDALRSYLESVYDDCVETLVGHLTPTAEEVGKESGAESFEANNWTPDEAASQVSALHAGGDHFDTEWGDLTDEFVNKIPEWKSLPEEAREQLESLAVQSANKEEAEEVLKLADERDTAMSDFRESGSIAGWDSREWDTDISRLADTAKKYVKADKAIKERMRDSIIRDFDLDDESSDDQIKEKCDSILKMDEDEKEEIRKESEKAKDLIKQAKEETTFMGMVSKIAEAASLEEQYGDWVSVRDLIPDDYIGDKFFVDYVKDEM